MTDVWGVLVAALGGAAIGVERQWSGHASGPDARFAGVRTFTMLGGVAGLAGSFWAGGAGALGVVLLVAAAALVVVAYSAASRRAIDGTTEVAALVTLAAGIASGLGEARVAAAVIALTVLLLVEKPQLHAAIARLDDAGMRAAVRFAVMAVVVLPLLPDGPYGPWGGIRPRELWLLVLFFSGLSFLAYVAQRTLGRGRGYPLAGLLGGLMSSTSVTLTFARMSRAEPTLAPALATGAIAASTVLFLRIAAAVAVLHLPLLPQLGIGLLVPAVVGACAAALAWRANHGGEGTALPGNPLQLRTALEMAVLFQGVLYAVWRARDVFGQAGVLASGAVLGLTDMDALVLSMARGAARGEALDLAARAITIGALSNTALKLAVAAALGAPAFRRRVGTALIAMGLTLAVLSWMR